MMDVARWPGADRILDAALALPERDRAPFVRQATTDPQLIAALDAVLAEATAADSFLVPAGAWVDGFGREALELVEDEPLALAAGTTIDSYEVMAAIGRGGMGEVYRARDTRLGRDVALKVLPARYARDPERRARFEREARLLASLNHAGIAAIYGIAEQHDVEALVLELVEGPTLAELIAQGPRPVAEVVAVGLELVDAIAAAHAGGILHRDLKPANIKVSSSGRVKILDFGLARVLDGDPRHGGAPVGLTRHSAHAVIGTVSYMSPEQARGLHVDERTDIWAFGCVLFEMLTGTRAFGGASAADVLAAVIEREPAFSLLPPATPEPLRRLLRRCLDKDPTRRLGYMPDARLDLEDALAPPLGSLEPAIADTPAPPRWSRTAIGVAVGLACVALGTALWFAWPDSGIPPPITRLTMMLPAGDRAVTAFQPMTAMSPQGRSVVYRASRAATTQLFRRDLDSLEPTAIPGTEGASSPFFSPDGQWLAFDADGVLKRVAMSGGTPVVICNAPGGVTGVWMPDDTIIFATNTGRVLQRVAASGGTPEALTTLDQSRGDTMHLLPQAIPGTSVILFTLVTGAGRHVATLDLETRAVRLVTEGSHATYVAPDTIVFARDGSLWGARLDPARAALEGAAVPLDERVAQSDNTVFHYAATASALVYLPPQSAEGRQRLVWIDRSGQQTPLDIEPRPIVRVSLSPDGQRLALAIDEDGNQDIWIASSSGTAMTRLTFEPTIETMPTWSPDGRFVAFRSEREGPGVFRRDAQGTGTVERLTATDGPIHSPYSWTPDGKTLLLAVFRSFRSQAIASVTPPDRTVRILLDGDYAQLNPQVSPDGRWLAYQSDETGRFEVYVRPYPDVESGRWLVSAAGGTSPRWGPEGRELFYYDGEAIARVTIATRGSALAPDRPARLFAVRPFGGRLGPGYEVSPDGQRLLFLMPTAMDAPRSTSLVVVQNWAQALTTRLAGRR
jgi:serine/threonine-protein kinase